MSADVCECEAMEESSGGRCGRLSWGRGAGEAAHLVVHSDLEGKAQGVAEALLAGDVQADLLRGRGRVHGDGQALPRRQHHVHRDVLSGLDSLGKARQSLGRPLPGLSPRARPEGLLLPDGRGGGRLLSAVLRGSQRAAPWEP